jgi:hypothetical protein
MGSNGSVPWYNRPARPFPARDWLNEWLKDRYPFNMPPVLFARVVASRPAGWERAERRFPAQLWLEARQPPSSPCQ